MQGLSQVITGGEGVGSWGYIHLFIKTFLQNSKIEKTVRVLLIFKPFKMCFCSNTLLILAKFCKDLQVFKDL